ncbi:HpcH/HpaI aldolase/citrate lyase family protein [Devosia naphthalenivorans]|uniref:HpcH/HpaI aldolase/citrate lyase family protein n=1 Tax=Devosia naphthalenivorans TaxID=2082392 RepID=UPI0013B05434|nr:CoA ester lyase [Devosia naphthalenivorans]
MTTPDSIWPIRSFLFVPAHREGWVEKAIRHAPEAVILDIEDSVPVAEKDMARGLLQAAVNLLNASGVAAFIRVNEFGDSTVADVRAAVVPGLTGLVLPKATDAEQTRRLHDLVSYAEGAAGMTHGSVALLPLPETAEGLQGAAEIASASPRVKGLFGAVGGPISGDVARGFGFRPTAVGTEQIYMNSKIVLDSRAAGSHYPIAGIIGTQIDDLEVVESLVRRAKAFGYTGVALIHPSHIKIAHQVFRPTDEEFLYFQGMLSAFSNAEQRGLGAIRYEGQMIDYAMLPLAREVVAEYERVRTRTAL